MALRETEIHTEVDVRCKFARIYFDALDDDDREVLDEWVHKRHYGAPNITRGLTQGGHKLGQDSVTRHLVGTCGCRNALDSLYGVKSRARDTMGELDG